MRQLVRRTSRFGLLVAVIAVALACTGTAVAVNKITSRDIANGTIQTKDLSKKAKRSLKGNRGRRGAPGPAGATGTTGAPGPAGAKGDKGDKGGFDTVIYTDSVHDNVGGVPDEVPLGEELEVTAVCPEGTIPIAGGFDYFTMRFENDEPIFETGFSDPDMVVNLSGANDVLPPSNDPEQVGDGVPDSWSIIVYNGGETNEPGFRDLAVAFAHCTAAQAEFFPPPPEAKSSKAGVWRNWRSLAR